MLIAVDTNVLLDEEAKKDDVVEALAIIRERLPSASLVVGEIVLQELANVATSDPDEADRELAAGALYNFLERKYTPIVPTGVEREISFEAAAKIRAQELIPEEEVNDSLIISQAAAAGCEILLSSDSHMLCANEDGALWAILGECHLKSDKILISSPRNIVLKFFRRK